MPVFVNQVRLDQQVAVESPLEASQDLSPPAETGSADQQIPSKKTKPKVIL